MKRFSNIFEKVSTELIEPLICITAKSPYKEPAYMELPVIKNWFSFPNQYKETNSDSIYIFIMNYGYKEQMFMIQTSSL